MFGFLRLLTGLHCKQALVHQDESDTNGNSIHVPVLYEVSFLQSRALYVASKQYKNMLIADEVEEDLAAGSVWR